MKYSELAEAIGNMTPEQQEQTVTVYVEGVGEYYPLVKDYPLLESQENDVLDKGHPYLKI